MSRAGPEEHEAVKEHPEAVLLDGSQIRWKDGRRIKLASVKNDPGIAISQLLHKIHLDMELSEQEATDFMAMQGKLLISSALVGKGMRDLLGTDAALERKAYWMDRYRTALAKMWPEEVGQMTPLQVTLLASNCMDSLMFAGGQSVKTVLAQAFGLLYRWV
jgi:hypothetical protein